jgi:predicted dehydrogenase
MDDRNPTRIALVGCGAVSQQYYAPALEELERQQLVRVAALLDPEASNRRELQKRFPQAFCPADLGELSARAADLAIIASPPRFHSEQAVRLLRAGMSVLCEKPMATALAEAEAMVAAAADSPGLLAVGMFRRFFPVAQLIRQIIRQGLLGEIVSFSISEGGEFRWPVQSAAHFRRETSNGGVLIDIGVHVLDLMIWWFGYPGELMYEDDAMGGIEANCRIQCYFDSGASGEVRLSRDCELSNRYIITGTKGWVSCEANETDAVEIGVAGSPFGVKARLHDIVAQSPQPLLNGPSATFQRSFVGQIENVVAAMRGEQPLLVSGEEALPSLRLIAACYQQRSLLPMPWLGAAELARARELNGAHTQW